MKKRIKAVWPIALLLAGTIYLAVLAAQVIVYTTDPCSSAHQGRISQREGHCDDR